MLEEYGVIQHLLTFQFSTNSEVFEAYQEYVAEQWLPSSEILLVHNPSSEPKIVMRKSMSEAQSRAGIESTSSYLLSVSTNLLRTHNAYFLEPPTI